MPFSKEIVKLYFWSSWAPAPLSPLICMTSPLHFPDTPHLFSFKMPSPRTPPSDLSNQCSLRGSTCTHVTIYVISSIHEVTACILEHAIISDSTFLSKSTNNQFPGYKKLGKFNDTCIWYDHYMMYIKLVTIALKDGLFYLQVKKTCSEL